MHKVHMLFCHMSYNQHGVYLVSPPEGYTLHERPNLNSKNSVIIILEANAGQGYIRGLVEVLDINTAYIMT